MAALATGNIEIESISQVEQADGLSCELGSTALLDVVQACLHAKLSEWIFLRELRVGTGFRNGAAQRLDAFALNCFAHTSMKRVCYEVKTSRADFLCEVKQRLKRRIGLRYSNEFYFVAPAGLLSTSEIPIECGLVEVGLFAEEDRQSVFAPTRVVLFISMWITKRTAESLYRLHGVKHLGRRGNLLRACCATNRRVSGMRP